MITLAFIGGMFGINISTFLINIYGWRNGMKVAGVLYLVIASMMRGIIRDINPAGTQDILQEKSSIKKLCYQLIEVIMDKQAWLSAMYAEFVPTIILAF